MRFTTLHAALGLLLTGRIRADCQGDNCLRALRASRLPTRAGIADCSAYLVATVTAPAQTITATASTLTTLTLTTSATSTATTETTVVLAGRQATSSRSIPDYATACANAAAYVSACSCLGVTASTVTVPAAPTTVTSTTVGTATVSTTASTTLTTTLTRTSTTAGPTPTLFRLRAAGPPAVAGRFVYGAAQSNLLLGDAATPDEFRFDGATGRVFMPGEVAARDAYMNQNAFVNAGNDGADSNVVFLDPADQVVATGWKFVRCAAPDGGAGLRNLICETEDGSGRDTWGWCQYSGEVDGHLALDVGVQALCELAVLELVPV